MRDLQDKFLNEHNIDSFLTMQDKEVLEFFHSNYGKTQQIIKQIENKVNQNEINKDIQAQMSEQVVDLPDPDI